MAKLTDSLPLTNGTNRIIDDPATPSGVGTVLTSMASTLDSYMGMREERARQKKAEAAEAEKRRRQDATYGAVTAYDRAVEMSKGNQVAGANSDVNTGIVPPPGETRPVPLGDVAPTADGVFAEPTTTEMPAGAAAAATAAGKKINNVAAAVQQQRMPAVSLSAALNSEFRALINQYPDQTEQVLDMWKKMGVDTTLFREGRDLADQQDFEREEAQDAVQTERKQREKWIAEGKELLGPLLTLNETTGKPYTDDEIIAHRLTAAAQANNISVATQQANLRLQNANLSEAERTADQGDLNKTIEQQLHVGLYNDSNPLVSMVQNVMSTISALPPGEQQAKFVQYGPQINAVLDNYVEQAVAAAMSQGYTGSPESLRSNLQGIVGRAKDLWSGDFSVAKAHMDTLNMTQTTLKLNAARVMPVFTTLKSMGINPETIQGYMEGLQGNTEMSKALREEMLGFNAEFGRETASVRMMNIIKILRGEETLSGMNAERARQMLPTLLPTTKALARRYNQGQPIAPDEVENSIGQMTIAARSLGAGSGLGAVLNATSGFATPNERAAILKLMNDPNNPDREGAMALVQASRAGSAQLLNIAQVQIPKVNQGSRYFKIAWDDKNGKYYIDDSARRAALRSLDGSVGAPGTPNPNRQFILQQRASIAKAKAPDDMYRWQDVANANLTNIMALGKADPTTPKGSELELRRYYGRNVPPPSLRNKGSGKPAIDPDKEIKSQFERLDKTLKDLSSLNTNVEMPAARGGRGTGVKINEDGSRVGYNLAGKPIEVPSPAAMDKTYASNPVYSTIVSTAAKYGVPKEVATRLAFIENKFKANMDPNGSDARGPIQVVPKYHNARAQKMFGKNVPELNLQEIVEVGMAFLADNYKKHKNWTEAAHDYIGRGDNDGNVKSRVYAELIG